jgi:zinc ribbon protein
MRANRLVLVPILVCVWTAAAWADIYCPKCGTRYPDSYNFCPKDGTDLREVRKAAGETPEATPAAKEVSPEKAPTEVWAPPSPTPSAPARDWAADLPIHLPSAYPDANLGDFALFEWTAPGSATSTIYFRAVLRKGEKGHISVLAATLPGVKKGAGPPGLREVLDAVGSQNARRVEWSDYRDFAQSFELDGKPLRSPFAGANKALRVTKKDYPISGGNVGCEVTEYSVQRGGNKDRHVIRMSDQVPFAFVESTYENAGERLRVYLFGTLDEDEMAPLQRSFPAGKSG